MSKIPAPFEHNATMMLNSNLALLMALRDFHLEAAQAETVRQLPGVG